jgi:hypothetical protein
MHIKEIEREEVDWKGPVAVSCEHGNELTGSIKAMTCFGKLSDY